MDTVSKEKRCNNCKDSKAFSEFYVRSGIDNPTHAGHYLTECKACMKLRTKNQKRLDNKEPYAFTEKIGIEYLASNGIPVLPGKALSHSWVDVIAFGCIKIEVKFARLKRVYGKDTFTFTATNRQSQNGFRADIILLICDYHTHMTYHLFSAANPVFYMNGRIKIGLTFVPGRTVPLKHGNNRVVMVQDMMDHAQDNIQLILDHLNHYCEGLKAGMPKAA